jgi:hypothetical protein
MGSGATAPIHPSVSEVLLPAADEVTVHLLAQGVAQEPPVATEAYPVLANSPIDMESVNSTTILHVAALTRIWLVQVPKPIVNR